MRFCLDDGSLLVGELSATGYGSQSEPTLHLPHPLTELPPTISAPRPTVKLPGFGTGVTADVSVENDRRHGRGVLWIVLALIIGGAGIAIALIVTRGRQQDNVSVSQSASRTASPSQSLESIESDSPSVESKGPANPADKSQSNRQTERATPLPRPTPLLKPTSVETNTEEPPPKSTPHAPISGGVLNGKAVHLVTPPYPAIARSAHASGVVQVQVLIDEDGNVIAARAISGNPLLQASAVAAARASKFSRTTMSGQPVKVNGIIIYNFVAQ